MERISCLAVALIFSTMLSGCDAKDLGLVTEIAFKDDVKRVQAYADGVSLANARLTKRVIALEKKLGITPPEEKLKVSK